MDAAITNNGTEATFIPGPNIQIDPGETKTWADITVGALDHNEVIKAGVVAGTLAVSVTPGPNDAALATQGQMVTDGMAVYTFANLPTGFNGRIAFVSNGRKPAEGAGLGTGVPCYYDATAGQWNTFAGDIAVTI